MSINIHLDIPALMKLLETSSPEFGVSIRQAAVAEVTRRAFAKYLPDEIKTAINRQIDGVRGEIFEALRTEGLVEKMLTDRLEAAKRGMSLSYLPASVEKKARDTIDEMMGLMARKIILEHLEAPEGIDALMKAKVESMTTRIMERFERESLTGWIEQEVANRIDTVIKQRVDAAMSAIKFGDTP